MATKKASTKSSTASKPAAKSAKKTTSKSTTRSTAAKKTTAAKTSVKPKQTAAAVEEKHTTTSASPSTESESKTKTSSERKVRIKPAYVILVVSVLALAGLLYLIRGYIVASTVNGQPIWRWQVIQEAEKQSGRQAITVKVRNALIEQEAKKQNVTVSQKEIDDEIKKLQENLKKQGQNFEQVLEMQGLTQKDLRELIRIDKLVTKMVGKDVNITDQQVSEYIETNKEALPQGQSENEQKAQVREQLKQQQLNEKVRTWLENLKKNANEQSFVDYYDPKATN